MSQFPLDRVLQGDCIQVMRSLPSSSVDMILTDPPYLVAYRDRPAAPSPMTTTRPG